MTSPSPMPNAGSGRVAHLLAKMNKGGAGSKPSLVVDKAPAKKHAPVAPAPPRGGSRRGSARRASASGAAAGGSLWTEKYTVDSVRSTTNMPQPVVILPERRHAGYFILKLAADADLKAVGDACARLQQVVDAAVKADPPTAAMERSPGAAGVAFSAALWEKLSGSAPPAGMTEFKARSGGAHGPMPATPELGDVFMHIKAPTQSLCFEVGRRFLASFPAGAVESFTDVFGWQYLDTRDLSGFEDGTENVKGAADRLTHATIPTKGAAAGTGGGSFVFTQIWEHHVEKLHEKSREEQEKVIGRTKPDSIEMDPAPETSHVGRVDTGDKIVRQSMPYGDLHKAGLFFIAYTKDLAVVDKLLDRMTGAGGDGHSDALMSFTEAKTGNYWYMPPNGKLDELQVPTAPPPPSDGDAVKIVAGSTGVGDLKSKFG